MASPAGPPHRPSSPLLRNARCYAPAPITTLLSDIAEWPALGLVLDVDALERSALAKIDRVMLMALQSLSRTGVHVVFASEHEPERAKRLHALLGDSWLAKPADAVTRLRQAIRDVRVVAISNDATVLSSLASVDRGIALGRPELVHAHIASAGDTDVRASLWWLLDERMRARAS